MSLKIKNILIKSVSTVLAFAIFMACYYALYIYCGYQRVRDNIYLTNITDETEVGAPLGEEITLMTYNIGFGAYSSDYSFFMDGGEYARAYSAEAVVENLGDAIKAIDNENPDVILLQEVDIDGTRSYHIDQSAKISEHFEGYDDGTAVNYDSPYFFYPLRQPIGKNKSGMMTLSKYNISWVRRRSLPVEDSLYKYLDLDRAYTMTKIPTVGGKNFLVYNVHLSAYTSDGSIADEQLTMLVEDMMSEYAKGHYVVALGDFNKDILGDSSQYFERAEGEFTWAQPINTELIPQGLNIYAATNAPSCRNADSPYRDDGTDFVLTVDGMLASDNVEVVLSETVDTKFKCSDHNPVKYKIILKVPEKSQ